jgi:hypothetical protein
MKKGIGGDASTEDTRQDGVANEAQHPRNHGDRAYCSQGFEQVHRKDSRQ